MSSNIDSIQSTIDQWATHEKEWALKYLIQFQQNMKNSDELTLDHHHDIKHISQSNNNREDSESIITQKRSEQELSESIETFPVYDRKNPFSARVLKKERITGDASNKEVYHLELSLQGSGLTYQPGDILGIHHDNPPRLVQAILTHFKIDADAPFFYRDHLRIAESILHHLVEITSINAMLLKKYQKLTDHEGLQKLLQNKDEKLAYLHGHDILDLLHDFPSDITFDQFITILTPRYPRLYSIASSMKKVDQQVHITIRTVRYEIKNREREGACSTFIADRIKERQLLPIFIESNKGFKLPNQPQHPIVMIGAGVGVAPFRSFLQEIDQLESSKKPESWLFFGEQKRESDYLYQSEWKAFQNKKTLGRIDTAFSRDKEQKVYVQHRITEQQSLLWEWIEHKNAHLYICGDKNHMAKEVQESLKEIVRKHGNLTTEEADKYIKTLKREKRLQLDVF
ncbi:hypothetical protein K5X82_14290 [Halosquirtibacter xylanolyticus]|uniref:diflavin oxidoreductase n=1 Tax=Halosquirtibacter xylanolyticus TaxID=3374599 RepID=UPI00374A5724|nr:hypothetical protein K5X82_14290 [Prolixibacteraceae bacterium]